ncbi:radical SAM protein [Nocardia sp. BSTN01]|uniref:radical SAM protein n=1 Tax=Nocardia sp. BSTN01 TaxID=2783665 RepID=UPI00188E68C6|nr:radical SAM protein [Nocardia sp. BSTN01]MBF5001804.1 radical SAM protein [Nocardia sp. BSTN01]
MDTGRYTPEQLLAYTQVDLTEGGVDETMYGRDEFNFSIGIQLSQAPISYIHDKLTYLSRTQYARSLH